MPFSISSVASQDFYVVDQSLSAYSTKSLLVNPSSLDKLMGGPTSGADEQELFPVSGDGKLEVGRLYDSSADPSVKFYLPPYQLHTVDGHHTTSLKYRSSQDDPDGPVGWLTIKLAAQARPETDFTVREIEHIVVGRLLYRMPIKRDGESDLPTGSMMEHFLGDWINVDADTQGMTRLEIARVDDSTVSFHGYGKCHPSDCDWGVIRVPFTPGQLVGTYDFGWKKTQITIARSGSQLLAQVFDDYTEADGRTDRISNYTLAGGGEASQGPVISLEVGALEPVESNIRRCRLPIYSREEYDRLYALMTEKDFETRLELQYFATVGYRTWRQFPFKRLGDTGDLINLTAGSLLQPQASTSFLNVPTMTTTSPNWTSAVSIVAKPVSQPSTVASTSLTSTIQLAPTVNFDKAISSSDLAVGTGDAMVIGIPVDALVDSEGEPVLIKIEAEARQVIHPFHFPVDSHAYMFDIPAAPSTNHILFPDDIMVDGITVTFFQDSLLRNQIYYEPQEFRLARLADVPYKPNLLFTFMDVLSKDKKLFYRVQLDYRLLPYINLRVLNVARDKYGQQARFTAIDPVSSKLMLRLPLDEAGGDIQSVDRSEALISFDDGILDSVSLSSTEFERIFAAFRSPSGIGLEGIVQATLFDGNRVDIPARLSLKENSGPLFDRNFNGPTPDGTAGRYRVTLNNRLESPVFIDGLSAVLVEGGAVAYPVAVTLPDGEPQPAGKDRVFILPGKAVKIDYDVVPADKPVLDIEPILETSIDTDYKLLWPSITTSEGYAPDDGTFKVTVFINAQYFAGSPPEGMEPLTGVEVQFRPNLSVSLTPDTPSVTVTLRMPLLPYLMQEDARQFHYQVINQHASGPGLQTDWIFRKGDTPLEITPAMPVES